MRWLVLLACACNQVYGLDETSGPDSDRDGVLDGTDNCTLVANRGQQDGDGDGFGDACDPCVAGPQLALDEDGDGVDDACDSCLNGANNDEDGDGLGDDCDVCPADGGDQADADGDGIGDTCDHAPGTPNVRVLFDGFAVSRSGWSTGFQPWALADGRFGPIPPIVGTYVGAWFRGLVLSPGGWRIAAEIVVPAVSTGIDPPRLSIGALTTEGGEIGRTCQLQYVDGWRLTRSDGTVVPITLGERVRVEVRERPGATIECLIDNKLVTSSTFSGPAGPYRPLFELRIPGAELTWIDIVR